MGYELRTQTVDPKRNTFQHLIDRFGDRPATRYQEGSFNIQPRENFHYRPYWDPEHELYDESYTVLRLTDPYKYTDPRQYYYATYVAARERHWEAFANTLSYIEERQLFDRLPESWHAILAQSVLPLRHYESGAQLVFINAARFAWGTTVSQPCAYAAFDRIGNAQLLSMVGLAQGGGSPEKLAEAKTGWLEDESLQGLRRLMEEVLIEKDWVTSMLAIEFADAQLYPLLYQHLDDQALFHGASAYTLLANHLNAWYADHKKWIVALIKAWVGDENHGAANAEALGEIVTRWLPQAHAAVHQLARGIEAKGDTSSTVSAADRYAHQVGTDLSALGIPVDSALISARA